MMKLLTINVTHVNLPGYRLPENSKLLIQLDDIVRNIPEICVKIFFNGADTVKSVPKIQELVSVYDTAYSDEMIRLGSAMNKLEKESATQFNLFMDEDDEFVDNYLEVFKSLVEYLKDPENDRALIMYAFDWQYISPNTGELHVMRHPQVNEDNSPKMYSMIGLGQSFIFNKSCPFNLPKPEINLMNDVAYYLEVWRISGGRCRIFNEPIILYRGDRSVMSKESNSALEDFSAYLCQGKEFEIY